MGAALLVHDSVLMVFFAMPSSSSTRPKTHHGNDQLWPGDRVDLGTDIAGLNLEIRALGNEIADLTQEDPVDFQTHRRAVCAVPTMNLGLQPVALSQKYAVLSPQVVDNSKQNPTSTSGYHSRQRFVA